MSLTAAHLPQFLPLPARRWLGKGFWAVADQGLFAASNFLLSVLLARHLGAAEYGAFGVGLSVVYLLGMIHSSLLADPMTVFGCGRYRDRHSWYFGIIGLGHGILLLPASAALAIIGGVFGMAGAALMARTLLWVALAAPGMLAVWLARRICYVMDDYRQAALTGLGQLVFILSGLALLGRRGALGIGSAFALLALAGVLSTLWCAARLGLFRGLSLQRRDLPAVAAAHWDYGRWTLTTGLAGFVSAQLYYFLVPALCGLESGAALRALANLVMPAFLLNNALGTVLIPALVRSRGTGGYGRTVANALVAVLGVNGLFWLGLGIFHAPAVRLLYGGRFLDHAGLLWAIGLLPLIGGLSNVLASSFSAREQPNRAFQGTAAACLTGLVVGLPLILCRGLGGATLALVINALAGLLCLAILYQRAHGAGHTRQHPAGEGWR